MAMVRNFEVMLGQILNHCLYNSVIFCKLFNLLLLHFTQLFFSCHDKDIILEPQFHFIAFSFIKDVLNTGDTNMAAEKYLKLNINLFIFILYNVG
jgi:hypothetical protein